MFYRMQTVESESRKWRKKRIKASSFCSLPFFHGICLLTQVWMVMYGLFHTGVEGITNCGPRSTVTMFNTYGASSNFVQLTLSTAPYTQPTTVKYTVALVGGGGARSNFANGGGGAGVMIIFNTSDPVNTVLTWLSGQGGNPGPTIATGVGFGGFTPQGFGSGGNGPAGNNMARNGAGGGQLTFVNKTIPGQSPVTLSIAGAGGGCGGMLNHPLHT